jgi:tetratricopeptide (TPR) repeat protein
MTGRLLLFPWRRYLSADEGREAGEQILATPISDRAGRAKELQLEEPATILFLLGHLASLLESSPGTARDEAEFLHWFIARPKRRIGVLDERAYFLGESALLAAKACRLLSLRDEMRRWLDRAEAAFRLSARHVEDLSRLAYERLALYIEERRFDEVLELVPELFDTMVEREMGEDAVKTRFLEAWALRETGRLKEAADVFNKIVEWAPSLANGENLLALACVNLGQIYAALGEPDRSLDLARRAAPVFRRLNNLFGLAKLQWTIGDTLRSQGDTAGAIVAYREAQKEFRDLGMRADVASLHLVIADLLLDLGQDPQAEWEVRAALPVIDEEKMVPEGVAADGLLRESLRRRQINRQALRDLHGYFRHDRS